MKNEIKPQPPKIPLAYAAGVLADLLEILEDEKGNIDERIDAEFRELATLSLETAVARRISLIASINSTIEATKAKAEAYRRRGQQLAAILERVKKLALETVEAHPELEFKSDIGRLTAQKSPPALELDIEYDDRRINYVVTADEELKHKIPQKYLTLISVMALDTEALKRDLTQGAEFTWARLKQNRHLRIRD